MWQRRTAKDRRKEFLHFIAASGSLAYSLNSANWLYFQPNQSFIRGKMCPFLMCLFLIVCVSEISIQPAVLVSQFSGCPTVSTRSACVTTLGKSNSSNPQCFCHNSRAVKQFQPQCFCHNSRAVQQFQPALLVSQHSGCPTVSIQHSEPEPATVIATVSSSRIIQWLRLRLAKR